MIIWQTQSCKSYSHLLLLKNCVPVHFFLVDHMRFNHVVYCYGGTRELKCKSYLLLIRHSLLHLYSSDVTFNITVSLLVQKSYIITSLVCRSHCRHLKG